MLKKAKVPDTSICIIFTYIIHKYIMYPSVSSKQTLRTTAGKNASLYWLRAMGKARPRSWPFLVKEISICSRSR